MKKNYKPFIRLAAAGLLITISFFSFGAQFPVTNTNNNGAGSLTDAINQANANPGPDTVTFSLPEGGSMTIAPTIPFPAITDTLFINGYSQPGAALGTIAGRTIRVNIDGVGLPITNDIFIVSSNNVQIAGLAIYRAPNFSSGIRIDLAINDVFIWGNYIGTDSTGLSTGLGNSYEGITCNTFNNTTPSSGIVVGVKGDGTNDANEGNLISCNGEDAVILWRTESSTIAGNIIGFNKNGTGTGFGNARNGILVTTSSNSNTIGTNGDGIADNVEGNKIGNNGGRGIFIASVSNSNIIAGNVVGLDISNGPAGNGTHGVEINPGSGNLIGTNADGTSDALERNTICANTGDGIRIVGGDFFGTSNSDGNTISGNAIGTNGAGTLVQGNTAYGVVILSNNDLNADDNVIGSNGDGNGDDLEGNLIANNTKGIVIATPAGASTHVGNRISRNSIYDNAQLGIDFNNDGVTANDNGDADTGPNELYNFPFITRSNVQGGNLVISGIAPGDAVIEFYIADAGGTEGKTYLFTAQVNNTYLGITDDSTGTASYSDVTYGTGTDEKFGFSVPVAGLPAPVTTGTIILALSIKSTSTVNSTSEFGPAFISTLPVRLIQFNGSVDKGVVTLLWTTTQEISNKHFEVERSNDGRSFDKLGTIAALGGVTNSYSFTDSKPNVVNFYRLKQVDKNGSISYSKVLLIRGDLDKIAAKVSPNPFRNAVNISFQVAKEEVVSIRLYNQTGQLVKQQTANASKGINTFNLGDLNNLSAGNYTIELRGETVNFRQQVVKQ